jgi:hypothetical protein
MAGAQSIQQNMWKACQIMIKNGLGESWAVYDIFKAYPNNLPQRKSLNKRASPILASRWIMQITNKRLFNILGWLLMVGLWMAMSATLVTLVARTWLLSGMPWRMGCVSEPYLHQKNFQPGKLPTSNLQSMTMGPLRSSSLAMWFWPEVEVVMMTSIWMWTQPEY